MAHGNIDQRRAVVNAMRVGRTLDNAAMRRIAERFGCSLCAVRSDLIHLTTASKKSTSCVTGKMRDRIRERDGNVCQYCGKKSANMIVEHIIPAALGGIAKTHNLTMACQSCNVKKSQSVWEPTNLNAITKDAPEWCLRVKTHVKLRRERERLGKIELDLFLADDDSVREAFNELGA